MSEQTSPLSGPSLRSASPDSALRGEEPDVALSAFDNEQRAEDMDGALEVVVKTSEIPVSTEVLFTENNKVLTKQDAPKSNGLPSSNAPSQLMIGIPTKATLPTSKVTTPRSPVSTAQMEWPKIEVQKKVQIQEGRNFSL
jgi:hypothetical protein